MASELLAKLKIKPDPVKEEALKIIINKPEPEEAKNIDIKVKIQDKSKLNKFNRDAFLQKINLANQTITKIPEIAKILSSPTKPDIPRQLEEEDDVVEAKKIFISKPKKLGKKLILEPSKTIDILTFKSPQKEELEKDITSPTKKTKKDSKLVPTIKEKQGLYEGEILEDKIQGINIQKLLPKKIDIKIKASPYYMNNRKHFIKFINNKFKHFKEKLDKDEEKLSCDALSGEFEPLTHQQLVRDYINLYTPYRGLLLYHGLGSGKTCSSIVIAEGMKTDKKIIVMTPASLEDNYKKELSKCGDPIYKTNQHWVFISTRGDKTKTKTNITTDSELENKLSKILGLTVDYIKKRKGDLGPGAWLVDDAKEPNYDTLEPGHKSHIDAQIEKMIENKYYFIRYNGLRMDKLRTLTGGFKNNLFDNRVVIIDEAHNLISRIVNKINSKHDTLPILLYKMLMSAKNTKIILLTGTPIINYPNEVGILYNILRGYIRTYIFKLVIKKDTQSEKTVAITQEKILDIFKNNSETYELLDYISYKASTTTLTVTQNPFGFKRYNNTGDGKSYDGVQLSSIETGISQDEFINSIISALRPHNIEIVQTAGGGISVEEFTALPDKLDDFKNYFIDDNHTIKNSDMFKRRILGLTSFVMDKEKIMPSYTHTAGKDFHIIKIPMSMFQLKLYEEARIQERKNESNNAKKRKKNVVMGGIYEETVSTYRIFSRAYCNYVFPDGMKRPMPKQDESIEQALKSGNMNEDIIDATSYDEKLQDVDGKYDLDELDVTIKDESKLRDTTYESRIKQALETLDSQKSTYLVGKNLMESSPKFARMLENIKNDKHIGTHLVYSQFRTLEGIGIFELVLRANGYSKFDIVKNDKGQWELYEPPDSFGTEKYVLYTGKEDKEKKEIFRNIFNGNFSSLTKSLKDQLERKSIDNLYGQLIKIFMITASGAEGIDLKNVRYVHITESYWHPIRMEQVIGRAKRICSHSKLPKEYQTVEVFLYLMTFTDEQLKNTAYKELITKDKGKKTDRALTSDEALYEISTIKENINKNILENIKESSIDCTLNTNNESGKDIKCFSFGKADLSSFAYMPSIQMEDKDSVEKLNVKQEIFKAVEITIKGVVYAFDKKSNIVYDLQSYKNALTKKGSLKKVGVIEVDANGKKTFSVEKDKNKDEDEDI